MQSLQLQKMNLEPLSDSELQDFDGGTLPSWMTKLGVAWLVDQVVRNWDDIKQGFKEGYNAPV